MNERLDALIEKYTNQIKKIKSELNWTSEGLVTTIAINVFIKDLQELKQTTVKENLTDEYINKVFEGWKIWWNRKVDVAYDMWIETWKRIAKEYLVSKQTDNTK